MRVWEFHDAKTNPPQKDGTYLVIMEGSNYCYYSCESWANNLYKIDKWDFNKERGKSGWYGYDSEYGYYKLDNVVEWAKLPEITWR